MAETTQENADPSMEEILASIRKIISDDNPPALVAAEPEHAAVEDVLELTQMVQDDGSVVEMKKPEPAPVMAAPPPPVIEPVPVLQPLPPGEPLISEPAATVAASALSNLANTVAIDRFSSGMNGHSYIGNGGRTLEDMAIELMRPLLKDWLDKNLPPIVEKLVQKEVERISRRS